MNPYSEYSEEEWRRRMENLALHSSRDASPTSGPKKRVDSNDIRYCGGGFRENDQEDPYPPQLDLPEEDDTTRLSTPPPETGPSYFHQPAVAPNSPAYGTAQPTPHPTQMEQYNMSTPYLQPSDLPEFWRQRGGRRVRSHHTQSSAHGTNSSEYLSAKDVRPWDTDTEGTQENEADNRQSEDRESTPYFTPSNSPSYFSQEATGESYGQGRAPESPHPYSPNYFMYDQRYSHNAVQGYEQEFHG